MTQKRESAEIIYETNDTPLRINESIVPRTKSITKNERKSLYNHISTHIPILLPFGSYIRYWNTFLLLILLYSIVEIPYSIAFEIIPKYNDALAIIGLIIDICLLFDIMLNFRTAYIDKYDRLRIIHDPKLIAARYLSRWFIIDLISSLPFSFIIIASQNNNNHKDVTTTIVLHYIRLFRIIKILRVIKLFKILNVYIEEVTHSLYHLNRGQLSLLKLIKIIASMMLIAHYFACFWYTIGNYAYRNNLPSWIDKIFENDDYDQGNFIKYSYAFYWSIVTLFTTGYGDIVPNNIYEQWFASIGIIFGSCLFAYFIGTMTNGLNEDLQHQASSEREEQSMVFCSYYDLPQELRRAVITHIKYFNDYNYAFKPDYIMNSLPNYLQKEISLHSKRSRLRGLDIFKSLPDEITGQVALKLKSKSCGVGKILYTKGDIGKELFIQRTGKSANKNIEINRGDVIGEDAILSKHRLDTVRCLTWSEFYVLDINDIVDVLKENYNALEAKQKWKSIQESIREPVTKQKHFVKFSTLRNFEEYIPMEARDSKSAKNVIVPPATLKLKNAKYEEYERKLEQENEAEDKKYSSFTNNDNKSMIHIVKMFGNMMERENSHLRNVKVVENHKKNKKSSTYYVSPDNTQNKIDIAAMNINNTTLIHTEYFDESDEIMHDIINYKKKDGNVVEMTKSEVNGTGKAMDIGHMTTVDLSTSNSDSNYNIAIDHSEEVP